MKTSEQLLVIGAVLVGLGALSKKEEAGVAVGLTIIDPRTGQPVPHNSPAGVIEGLSYVARMTVTNLSAKGGVAQAAKLTLALMGEVGITTTLLFTDSATGLVRSDRWDYTFAPSEAKGWDSFFTPPLGTGGMTGSIKATVLAPDGTFLKEASELLTVEAEAPIVYAAAVTLTVA